MLENKLLKMQIPPDFFQICDKFEKLIRENLDIIKKCKICFKIILLHKYH